MPKQDPIFSKRTKEFTFYIPVLSEPSPLSFFILAFFLFISVISLLLIIYPVIMGHTSPIVAMGESVSPVVGLAFTLFLLRAKIREYKANKFKSDDPDQPK